jgi:uncharacterized linocin/CFP29 family protein
MNELLRELAPVPEVAWKEIDGEARRALKVTLAARRLVDFSGPLGTGTSAVNLGQVEPLREGPAPGIEAQLRTSLPLVEFRTPFELGRRELEAVGRGSRRPDLGSVTEAARRAALAEDRAVFHGYAPGRVEGLCEASADAALRLSDDFEKYPGAVAEATGRLREAGIDGPYVIALGPRCYTGLTRTVTSGGYPVIEHVRRLLDEPIIWAPGLDGALVASLRGGDFELTVGQDFSIGYLDHSASTVRLYLQESFTYRTLAPEAAIPLRYGSR